jgi:hypothetical protein
MGDVPGMPSAVKRDVVKRKQKKAAAAAGARVPYEDLFFPEEGSFIHDGERVAVSDPQTRDALAGLGINRGSYFITRGMSSRDWSPDRLDYLHLHKKILWALVCAPGKRGGGWFTLTGFVEVKGREWRRVACANSATAVYSRWADLTPEERSEILDAPHPPSGVDRSLTDVAWHMAEQDFGLKLGQD